MQRVDDSPRGRDLSARAVWRLRSASGRERSRDTRFFRLELPPSEPIRSKWLLVFDAPPDVKDTAFLVWSPRDAQGEVSQWIYLVGQRKVRRVAAGTRNNAFLGTDFTFEDLTERAAGQDRHALLRTERLRSRQHYVVESVPRVPDAPYGRRVQWVDPEGWTVSQIDFYSRENELEKTLRSDWSRIGEAWIAVRLEMQNHRNGHRTLIEVSDLRVDSGLDAERFAASRLPGASR